MLTEFIISKNNFNCRDFTIFSQVYILLTSYIEHLISEPSLKNEFIPNVYHRLSSGTVLTYNYTN